MARRKAEETTPEIDEAPSFFAFDEDNTTPDAQTAKDADADADAAEAARVEADARAERVAQAARDGVAPDYADTDAGIAAAKTSAYRDAAEGYYRDPDAHVEPDPHENPADQFAKAQAIEAEQNRAQG